MASCSHRTSSSAVGPHVSGADAPSRACSDFYEYANAEWLKTKAIPADAGRWGTRDEMRARVRSTLREILESLATTAPPAGSTEEKVGRFYASCMDQARAEADGATPLREELARIETIASREQLIAEIARMHRADIGAIFTLTAAQSPKHAADTIGEISTYGALGLPDRDYYFRADAAGERTRATYVTHVARTLELSGLSKTVSETRAASVIAFETALARASLTTREQRDPVALVHEMTVAQVAALTPSWPWPAYLRALGRPDLTVINVTEPKYLEAVEALLRAPRLEDWRAYLRWRYVARAAPYLSQAFDDEDFRYAATLSGARELAPRWKRCVAITDEMLGDAVGRLYVARTFPPASKVKVMALVKNVTAALRDDLSTLPWMTEPTRQQALAKLDSFVIKIGYPDTWRDYSTLSIRAESFWPNLVAARTFETARQLARIGRPADPDEWLQTPATVDAYFDQNLNKVSFSAGMLQPPYFDADGDEPSNYGALGALIGHELTHGFDDRGRQFDAQANLRDWWAPADAAAFAKRAALVEGQYDRYEVVDGLHIDGKQTLSENIADIGGVKLAYSAMERALAGKPRTHVEGMTPEQRFFIAYARSWAEVFRPEFLRTFVQTNTHAPAKWRILGPLSNMPEFAEAFGCRSTDPMVRPPHLRAQIW